MSERPPAPTRRIDNRLPGPGVRATYLYGTDGPPLGSVDGAAWSDTDTSLYVLDGLSNRVRVYDREGRYQTSFAGEGEGPGELENTGEGAYFDRIAAQREGLVAIRGHRRIHLFRRPGGFLQRVEPKTMPALLPAFNVAAFTDSAFLYAETHAFDVGADYETRKRLDLRLIRAGTSGSRHFAYVHNELARLPRFESASYPDSPWTTKYDRLWDARAPGFLAVVSLRRHGVCFFDAALELVDAYRIRAPVVEVSEEAKERVIESRDEEYGPEAPMIGEPWEEFYDYWPPDLPRYTDVVLRDDSVAWLRRPISETRWYSPSERDRRPTYAVDLVHATRGYLGTFETRRFPVAFVDGCPLVVETRVGTNGARMVSGFHGLAAYCRSS